MNTQIVTWSTVVALVSGKQMQVELRVDLEAMARSYALKAEASKSKKISPCGGAAIVKIVGYPTNPSLRK